jgi:hypothetical protein
MIMFKLLVHMADKRKFLLKTESAWVLCSINVYQQASLSSFSNKILSLSLVVIHQCQDMSSSEKLFCANFYSKSFFPLFHPSYKVFESGVGITFKKSDRIANFENLIGSNLIGSQILKTWSDRTWSDRKFSRPDRTWSDRRLTKTWSSSIRSGYADFGFE